LVDDCVVTTEEEEDGVTTFVAKSFSKTRHEFQTWFSLSHLFRRVTRAPNFVLVRMICQIALLGVCQTLYVVVKDTDDATRVHVEYVEFTRCGRCGKVFIIVVWCDDGG